MLVEPDLNPNATEPQTEPHCKNLEKSLGSIFYILKKSCEEMTTLKKEIEENENSASEGIKSEQTKTGKPEKAR